MYYAIDLDPCATGSERTPSSPPHSASSTYPSLDQRNPPSNPFSSPTEAHIPLRQKSESSITPPFQPCCHQHDSLHRFPSGMNIFLGRSELAPDPPYRHRPTINSPVYSLSTPSTTSPTVFAGIESTVLQIDVVSVMDKHPSPIYRDGRNGVFAKDPVEKWDPLGRVVSLHAYQHDVGAVKLIKQRNVGETRPRGGQWDDRWVEA